MDKTFGPKFKKILKLEAIAALMLVVHEMKQDGKLKSTNAEIYLLIGAFNLAIFIFALTEAPKLFAFLSIAFSHAVAKTIIAAVTYIVPVVLMFAVVVLVVMWFVGERLK